MSQAIIGFLILCTPALFLVAAYLFYKNSAIQAFVQNKLVWKNPIDKAQYDYIDKLLSSQLRFFKLLSVNGKAKFIHRTLKFKESKNFIGKDTRGYRRYEVNYFWSFYSAYFWIRLLYVRKHQRVLYLSYCFL